MVLQRNWIKIINQITRISMKRVHMRGFKKVYMVTILEGNGVDEAFREVKYFYDDENDTLIGKLDPLTPPQA